MGRRRIVVFPFPFQGHVNPMLHLANILHAEGISITFLITNNNHVHPSSHPHLSFVSLQPSLPHNYSSSPSLAGALSMVPLLNDNYSQSFQHFLTGLLSHASMEEEEEEEKVCCLVTDPFWFFTHPVALHLKLPRLTLRTGCLFSTLAYSYFPLLLQQGVLPVHESEMEREIPELAPLRGRDLPTLGVHDQRSYYDCMEKLVENIKTSSGMICNTFEELEHSALSKSQLRFQIPHFTIGPFHLQSKPKTTAPPPHGWPSVVAWLDQQPPRSVLYVSFGTVVDINITSFTEMAWGLCESEVSFLWVIRPGLVQGREEEEAPPYPQGFEEKVGDRGRLVKWAVQVEVLSHAAVGGFWTHNGWNSTLESISAGVPMVCMPGGVDQMVNSRLVCNCWKVGVQIEKGFNREEIKKAVVQVMVNKEGEDMRKRAQLLKEKACLSVQNAGSSANYVHRLLAFINSS